MDIQSIKRRFGIVGNNPELNHALEIALQVANTDLAVLITGESGVGKEIFSKIIHEGSPRKHESFIAVNCGAIPEGTIDSELFGHEKGAFTGANDMRKGYFEQVDKGSIFLDEVGEMPLSTQARLLRVLESKEFIKVGSSKTQKTDVRVIAATNSDLLAAIRKGKFRDDLFYRLNTVPIKVPALRDRKEDILVLFRKFCVDFADKYNSQVIQLDDEAKHFLTNYKWPGNVRELKNIAEQMSVLSKGKSVGVEELRTFLPDNPQSNDLMLHDDPVGNSISEREILYKVLFDMKHDLNDLKKVVFELVRRGEINESDLPSSLKQVSDSSTIQQDIKALGVSGNQEPISTERSEKPVIIDHQGDNYAVETVEESLSIAEKEKELISKALTKHKGRRRNAALDLGISERTLYRKIKEYDLEEN